MSNSVVAALPATGPVLIEPWTPASSERRTRQEQLCLLYGVIAALNDRQLPADEIALTAVYGLYCAVVGLPLPEGLTVLGSLAWSTQLVQLVERELTAGLVLLDPDRGGYRLGSEAGFIAGQWPGRARLAELCDLLPLANEPRLCRWLAVARQIRLRVWYGGALDSAAWAALLAEFTPHQRTIATLLADRLRLGRPTPDGSPR